jgi:hypothetical protein
LPRLNERAAPTTVEVIAPGFVVTVHGAIPRRLRLFERAALGLLCDNLARFLHEIQFRDRN